MEISTAATVLRAVASELAEKAKGSLPKLRDGERISREWYEDGVYSRETVFNGRTYLVQYDFRLQKCA